MATKRKADNSPNSDIQSKKSIRDEDYKNQNEKGEKFRFLLVGKTGSGKSSTGNTILGQPLFSTAVSFSSVTDQCQLHSAVRLGTSIDVMDCPGLLDIDSSDEDVGSTILETLTSMDPGPDIIAYVMDIGRYTAEDFSAYRRLKALMDDVTDHMIIIMTYGDRLNGGDVWHILQQAPSHLQTVLKECGHRVVVFDNTLQHPKPSQLRTLLREARKLKTQNNHRPYTLELGEGVTKEVEGRLQDVEKMEIRRKEFVKKLIRRKEEAERNLRLERQHWEQRDQQRETGFRRQERTLESEKQDLSQKLRKQKAVNAEIKGKVDRLEEELQGQRLAYGV